MKPWVTTCKVKGGRIISWRVGRVIWQQQVVQDGCAIVPNPEAVVVGKKTYRAACSLTGDPFWFEVVPRETRSEVTPA